MLVHVLSEDTTYELRGGITNSDWAEFGALDDAPSDGAPYVRKDEAWVTLSSVLSGVQVVIYAENNSNFYKVAKGYGNTSVDIEVGDEIIYRDSTTKKRAVYYVLNATLTLPADFADRAKLDKYNESAPAL